MNMFNMLGIAFSQPFIGYLLITRLSPKSSHLAIRHTRLLTHAPLSKRNPLQTSRELMN